MIDLKSQSRRFGLALLSVGLFSCTGHLQRPTETVVVKHPETWVAAGKGQSGKVATGWVKDLRSPQLTSLVKEAVNRSPDLAATAASVRASAESVRISHAALQPQANAGLNASRSRTETGAGGGDRLYSSNLSNQFGVSWELDLWGRLRDQRDAAYFNYEAALADYRSARLSLAASVARNYIQLISAEQQVQLSEMTVASFEKNLRIIERNYKSGVPGVRALDVQFGRSNVAGAERGLRIQKQSRDEARRGLERLLGRYPAAALRGGNTLPDLTKSVPAGLPASLVERRPDLAAQRYQLLASAKSADASRKNLLPDLRLSANTGAGGSELSRLFDPGFLASSIGASIGQPVFTGGRLTASARQALERNNAEIQRYVSASLSAFEEVENRLAAERYLTEQEAFLQQEVDASTLAEEQAERDYTEGIEGASILSLLEAQRRAFNSRQSLIRLKADRLLNRISLHLALGGDF